MKSTLEHYKLVVNRNQSSITKSFSKVNNFKRIIDIVNIFFELVSNVKAHLQQ